MSDINDFRKKLRSSPETIEFDEVIQLIDKLYVFTATEFSNGTGNETVINNAGENTGSCKIFSFAKLQQLSAQQTLYCFGRYYRNDVLKHADNNDHANIRTFIKHGWNHIKFSGKALHPRQTGSTAIK